MRLRPGWENFGIMKCWYVQLIFDSFSEGKLLDSRKKNNSSLLRKPCCLSYFQTVKYFAASVFSVNLIVGSIKLSFFFFSSFENNKDIYTVLITSFSMAWEENLLDDLLNFAATPKGLLLLQRTGAINECVTFMFNRYAKKLQVRILICHRQKELLIL